MLFSTDDKITLVLIMYIAVEGCCHGELNKIYETLQYIEANEKIKIDLLLCCGDFQAVRNEQDLKCMACPDKYKSMQDFWEYYNGKKIAPYLTIFIGGNHEASNYLQELPYGGWVAPKIYFMGYAGVVNYKGLRIGGLSGIFKQHDYAKGHYEKPPYSSQSERSVYHIRQLEVFKLKQLKQPIDIMMSHDWPNGVVEYGDKLSLLSRKKHFADDIHNHQLGSLPAWGILTTLRPKYWFSGHLHVKFAAMVEHELDESSAEMTQNKNNVTRFLALDKCLPKRDFIQVIDIECSDHPPDQDELCYDAEWLTVLKNTNELMSTSYKSVLLPTKGLSEKWDYSVNETKIKELEFDKFAAGPLFEVFSNELVLTLFNDDLKIPLNFHRDESCVYNPSLRSNGPVQCRINPQTTELCAQLAINDPVMMLINAEEGADSSFNTSSWISEDGDELPSAIVSNTSFNPDEIDLDDDSDNELNDDKSEDDPTADKNEHKNVDDNSSSKQDLNYKKSEDSERVFPKLAANFGMNLPAPISSTPVPPVRSSMLQQDSHLSCVNEVDAKPSLEKTGEAQEKNTISKEQPVAKKFKRRNASLYSSNLEENDAIS